VHVIGQFRPIPVRMLLTQQLQQQVDSCTVAVWGEIDGCSTQFLGGASNPTPLGTTLLRLSHTRILTCYLLLLLPLLLLLCCHCCCSKVP